MAEPDRPRSGGGSDDWVDALLPLDFAWRNVVRRHPWIALTAAAGVGYVLGSRRGTRLLEDLADLASDGVASGLGAYLGSDFLDG